MSRSNLDLRGSLVPIAASVVAAVFALRDVISSSGVPAYRHDWSWPMTQVQLQGAVFSNIAIWNTSGLGSPSVLPVNHPVFWIWHYAAMVLSSDVVLKATLGLLFTATALGSYALVRRVSGLPVAASLAVAILVLLGPATFSKFVAGHLYYLIGFALLPWCLFGMLRSESTVRAALTAGLLGALIIIQPQLWIVAILAATIIAFAGARRRLRLLPLTLAAAAVLAVPAMYLAVTTRADGVALPQLQTLTTWEYNNSAHPVDAIVALGYFTGYAERAYSRLPLGHAVENILYIVPLLAVFGLVTNVRSRIAWVFGVLWVLAFFMVCGLYGPLSLPISTAFANWPWFSLFRELYHFAAPMWLFSCVLAALGLARLPPKLRTIAPVVAVIPAIALWIPPHYGGQLFLWQPDPKAASAIDRLGHEGGNDRFLLLPAQAPVAPHGLKSGGANPLTYTAGGHPFANEYDVSPQLQIALFYLDGGNPRGSEWLKMLGIGHCVTVPSLHSTFMNNVIMPARWPSVLPNSKHVQPPSARCPFAIAYAPPAIMATALQVVSSPLDWDRGPTFIQAGAQPDPTIDARPHVSDQTTDPSIAWVRSYLWSWILPEVAAADEGSALTWSDVPLEVPPELRGQLYVRVYALRANLMTDRGTVLRLPKNSVSWIRLPRGTKSLRRLGPGLVVVERFTIGTVQARLKRLPSQIRSTPVRFDAASLTAAGSSRENDFWVVLKQRYSPLWIAAAGAGATIRHQVAGGYANAWHIHCPQRCAFKVWYAPHRTVRALLYASLLVWLLLALFCAISSKTRRSSRSLP